MAVKTAVQHSSTLPQYVLFFLITACSLTQKANALELEFDWWTDDLITNNIMLLSNAAIIADWAQTRHIADDDAYYEKNSHLGKYPTSGEVNRYFVESLIFHNLFGAILPKKYKNLYYVSQFTYRFDVVNNNAEIGVEFQF